MRTVLITGASRGIGAACAKAFAAKGDRVILNYKTSRQKAETLAEELNGIALCADISDSKQVKTMFQEINTRYGGVDILVNNAGIAHFSMFDAMTDEDWNNVLSTNLTGAFYCIREALPFMIHQKKGAIINISSIWGICGASCEVAYSAAKAGLIGMTKALAKEVGPSGISVNCVAPGVIDTDMNRTLSEETMQALEEETPLGRMGTAEEIANTVVYLAEDCHFMTGQILSPNGGLVI
ncbi:MAG: 3-oxoacyl-ACP reductase FabG [Clostridia bacterium]|nr:3-oxoacyl-ACP reductase FabG [Clostridia bacterium]